MKRVTTAVMAVCLTISCASVCRAEDEVIGQVVSMTPNRIVVEVPHEGRRRFDVTKRTRFFSADTPLPGIKKLLPHSRVRIAPKDGEAQAIVILRAPK